MSMSKSFSLPFGIEPISRTGLSLSNGQAILIAIAAGAAYYVGAIIGFALTFPAHAVSTLWPPNAILLACLLLVPMRKWWIVLLGAFAAHITVQLQTGVPVLMMLCWFISNSSEALIGAYGMLRLIRGPIKFDSVFSISAFAISAVVLAPVLSSFLDAAFVVLVGWKSDSYWQVWRMRLPANVLADLTLVPFIVLWFTNAGIWLRRASWQRFAEALFLICGLLVVSFFVFGQHNAGPGTLPVLVYLPLPFLLWAAVRWGPAGASTSLLVLTLVSIWGAIHGLGPFITRSPEENVRSLQVFLIAVSFPLLFLAALVEERRVKEKALRAGEARYRALVMAGADMVWRADARGEVSFATRVWQDLTGQSKKKTQNFGWLEALHPDDRERGRLSWEQAITHKRIFEDELRVRTRKWGYRHFHFHAVPILAPNGTVREWIGANTDITDRRRAESRLKAQHEITRMLSEAASIADAAPRIIQSICECLGWRVGEIWSINPDTNHLTLLKSWHFPSEELSAFALASLPFTFAPGIGLLGHVWKSGKPMWISKLYDESDYPRAALARKAGLCCALSFPLLLGDETFGVMVFFSREEREPDEDLIRMMTNLGNQIGQFIDRTRKEHALRESEARFRSMADTAPVMIWMSGVNKLCTFFNKGWLGFTGRTLEEELGNGWAKGIHREDVDRCVEMYNKSFTARQAFTMEYRLRRWDGEYRSVLDRGVPRFAPDGAFLGYIGTATDITEVKRAESELQLQRREIAHVTRISTMGELAASLAHELNQPLTAILSNAQAAQRFLAAKPVDLQEVHEILKDIVQDNNRAGEVIRRMRTLAKKEELEFVSLEVTTVIRDVVALIHSDAILHNIGVFLDLNPALPFVRGNKVQLQQVLLNLLLNAFDAMKDCPAQDREIKVLAQVENPRMVRIAVRDHGTGLSAGKMDEIFQPFYTTKRDGLGMGLSISRSIIEAHGGHLWAENNADHPGATFSFTVPVEGAERKNGLME